MEIFNEFMHEYGIQILYAIVTGVAAWIGSVTAKYYKRWVNTREKERLAKIVVTAVEQIYKNLHGEEKFNKAYEALSEMLAEHEIHISEFEIQMLIEAAVGEGNKAFEHAISTDDPDQITMEDEEE